MLQKKKLESQRLTINTRKKHTLHGCMLLTPMFIIQSCIEANNFIRKKIIPTHCLQTNQQNNLYTQIHAAILQAERIQNISIVQECNSIQLYCCSEMPSGNSHQEKDDDHHEHQEDVDDHDDDDNDHDDDETYQKKDEEEEEESEEEEEKSKKKIKKKKFTSSTR